MGRTFENRKHAMAKRSDRNAKAFTRAGRQIAMAVKSGGPEPDGNPGLRRAIENARAVSMPKDRIQAAIEKAAGLGDNASYEELLYEGYGPHGIAMIVVCTSDNVTRTAANVRAAFRKGNGNLGASGSVAFQFDHFGFFKLNPEGIERDEIELELIDHGLEQLEDSEGEKGEPLLAVYCKRESFGALQTALEERKLETVSSGFVWMPQSTSALGEAEAEEVYSLVSRLEDDDDVQEVFTNLE